MKSKRLAYLESKVATTASATTDVRVDKSLDEGAIHYPLLAKYDFAGQGPRPGSDIDARLFNQASQLQTRGEKIAPILIRMAWIMLRLIIGLVFVLIVLRGRTFNCMGGGISFR